MSKIKNGGLNQYGKVYSLNRIGGERVNSWDDFPVALVYSTVSKHWKCRNVKPLNTLIIQWAT